MPYKSSEETAGKLVKCDIDYEDRVDIMESILDKDEIDTLLHTLGLVEPDESDKEEAYRYYKVTAEELLEALHYLCKLYCVDRGMWIHKLGRTTMFIDLLFDHTPQEIMKIYNDFINEDKI